MEQGLFIFDRCLLYSGGYTGEMFLQMAISTAAPLVEQGQGSARPWYQARLAVDAGRAIDELAAAHPDNWVAWSADVRQWSLRPGVYASRLRLELTDGTRRKVLWGRPHNPRPVIRVALERALDG